MQGHLKYFHPAFSREPDQIPYVQHLLERDAPKIAKIMRQGGIVLICGSMAMQKGVTETLDHIVCHHNQKPLSHYQNKKQLRMDCY